MEFQSSKVRKSLLDYKIEFIRSREQAELNQTEVGAMTGVEQSTVSNWENTNLLDKNQPAGIIPLLPKSISDRLLFHLCELAGGQYLKNLPPLKLVHNGIDDEIKDLIVVEATIIKHFEADPEKAMREIEALDNVVVRLRAEIKHKIGAKS